MTSIQTYTEAIAEARRFIERAEKAIDEAVDEAVDRSYTYGQENAAAKRSSMDLTRSLAKLRRSQ